MPLLRPSEGNLGQCFGMFGPSRVILGSTCARTFCVARARLRKRQHEEEHVAQNIACVHVRALFCRTCAFAQAATSRGTLCSKRCVCALARMLLLRTRLRKQQLDYEKTCSKHCVCARARAFPHARLKATRRGQKMRALCSQVEWGKIGPLDAFVFWPFSLKSISFVREN